MDIKLYEFEIHGDYRGSLISLEENINVPFAIKRVYFIYDTEDKVIRGNHAHHTLEQILVCVHGSCVILLSDGIESKSIYLRRPNCGLYIPPKIWHEMSSFSEGAVLMSLASDFYKEDDYIRDYNKFISLVSCRKDSDK